MEGSLEGIGSPLISGVQ